MSGGQPAGDHEEHETASLPFGTPSTSTLSGSWATSSCCFSFSSFAAPDAFRGWSVLPSWNANSSDLPSRVACGSAAFSSSYSEFFGVMPPPSTTERETPSVRPCSRSMK
jgi:hypothetical protein